MPAEEIQLSASEFVSKFEYDYDKERWERFAAERLVNHISFLIQKNKSKLIVSDDMVERRIELYVASPETFWKIVREEAEKITMRFMSQ